MPDEYASQQFSPDLSSRLRDLEEKNRLLKERILLIGQNLVNEREDMFNTMQEMKKTLLVLKEEQIKMKDFMQRFSEQLDEGARKEELLILQRQIDIIKILNQKQ